MPYCFNLDQNAGQLLLRPTIHSLLFLVTQNRFSQYWIIFMLQIISQCAIVYKLVEKERVPR
ncbi:hypothetical protein ACJX0J_012030 [Zea mays]